MYLPKNVVAYFFSCVYKIFCIFTEKRCRVFVLMHVCTKFSVYYRRGSKGGGGVTPPALDHQFFFSTNFLTIAKIKKYSMDAMYLNQMFINPRPPPVGAGAKGACCTRPSLTPPAKKTWIRACIRPTYLNTL